MRELKKTRLLLFVTLLTVSSLSAQNELDYYRSIHSELETRKFIKRIYTNIDVMPLSLSDYDAIRPKNIGDSFYDPAFGRKWTFIYEYGHTIMNSERNAWNADSSFFFLNKSTGTTSRTIALFDGVSGAFIQYETINNLVKTDGKLPELRWMPGDPDKLFYLHSNKLYTYCLKENKTELYQEFASFSLTVHKIAGGDGNDVAPNGDFLIGNKGDKCFVYNFYEKKVVRHVDGERDYWNPEQTFPTFSLGQVDYAIAFAGFIFELDEDGGGTKIRDYNGLEKQKLYKRTPHMDPTYFNDNGNLIPGIIVRYNNADAEYYQGLGLSSQAKRAYFHGFDPDAPTELKRFTMDLWPSENIGSGGQVSSNRHGESSLLSTHGPAVYDLTWSTRYGEVYESALESESCQLPRRIAHHYIGYESDYSSSSYQPEGWQSPDGTYVIIKTYWGWYKVDLAPERLTPQEVSDYLDNPSPATYLLTVNNGEGDVLCVEGASRTIAADIAPSGMVFDKWTGDTEYIEDTESEATTLSMPAKDITLTATFRDADRYSINITIDGSGSVSYTPNQSEYTQGTVVALTAIPDTGYEFVRWRGDIESSQNPIAMQMDSTIEIMAVFSDGEYLTNLRNNIVSATQISIIKNPVVINPVFRVMLAESSDVEIETFSITGAKADYQYYEILEEGEHLLFPEMKNIEQPGLYFSVITAKRTRKTVRFTKL